MFILFWRYVNFCHKMQNNRRCNTEWFVKMQVREAPHNHTFIIALHLVILICEIHKGDFAFQWMSCLVIYRFNPMQRFKIKRLLLLSWTLLMTRNFSIRCFIMWSALVVVFFENILMEFPYFTFLHLYLYIYSNFLLTSIDISKQYQYISWIMIIFEFKKISAFDSSYIFIVFWLLF